MSDTIEISHSEILNKLKTKLMGGKLLTMQSPLHGMLTLFAVNSSVYELFGFRISTVGIRDVADVVYRIEDMLKMQQSNTLPDFKYNVDAELQQAYYKSLEGKSAFCIESLELSSERLLTKHKLYFLEKFDGYRFETTDDKGNMIYANANRFLDKEKYFKFLKKNPATFSELVTVVEDYQEKHIRYIESQ